MIKKLLLTLLFIPTLAFANLGDTREKIESMDYGHPFKDYVYSTKTTSATYLDPDGETAVVILYFNNKSVGETYFSREGREFSSEYIREVVGRYSQNWTPFDVEDTHCRCIKSYNSGYYRICYGPVAGTPVQFGLTVICTDAREALEDVPVKAPYKASSGLRL